MTERHLLSEFKTTSALFKILRQLKSDGELAIFILNIAPPCAVIDDPIVTIERKYLGHYDPSKAKKLDASLSYNLSIQLVEVSGIFGGLIGWYAHHILLDGCRRSNIYGLCLP